MSDDKLHPLGIGRFVGGKHEKKDEDQRPVGETLRPITPEQRKKALEKKEDKPGRHRKED